MQWYEYLLIGLGALLLILISVVLIRTACFKPKDNVIKDNSVIEFDKEKAVRSLAEMVKCKTISNADKEKEDKAEFEKFERLLPTLFPLTCLSCEKIKVKGRAIVYKLKGKSSASPSVLMSHYDVVEAEESLWSKPAFEGIMEDGVLWGRGTLDTKVTLNGAMNALENLLKQGFVPQNDIYLAFGGDEEVNGTGASSVVDYFEENGIMPGLVVDEGGAVVQNVFPGVKQACGLIGIAEKGLLNAEFEVDSAGGHSSAPPPKTSIGRLSKACVNIESNPFTFRITKPAKAMFDVLGRHSTFVYKMIFANLWLFKGALNFICKKSGGEINALMRTTVAFTQMQGSSTINVMPPIASMCANLRLMKGDTVDSALKELEKKANDKKIKVSKIAGYNPSRISRVDCDAYNKVATAVASTWTDAIVSPYLRVHCSDSRHYGRISDKVYRFSAMALTKEERATIHGNDERITFENIYRSTEFYIRLVKQL